jgi:tRNA(Phe) wybutosine-synthesizing methylase Tyw3
MDTIEELRTYMDEQNAIDEACIKRLEGSGRLEDIRQISYCQGRIMAYRMLETNTRDWK